MDDIVRRLMQVVHELSGEENSLTVVKSTPEYLNLLEEAASEIRKLRRLVREPGF